MAFSQSLNPNALEKHNRVLYLPSSWNRLMSLIKYQVPSGGFAVMEGDFGAGKSSFGKIFEKKLVLDESIDCQVVQVHPLSTIQQIRAQLPKNPEKPMIVIIDDAHEASTLLLQKLTAPLDNIYWLLLAEPGISDRVEAFAERRVELPLFSKEDCFEFLQKQLQDQPKYAQVSQMQSDTIWYSSEGLPKDIILHAKQNLNKLFSGQESSENFEKANKSWYMTAALGAAALILIVLLAINMGADEDIENSSEAEELVIDSLDSSEDQNKVQPEEESFTENAEDTQTQQAELSKEETSKEEKLKETGSLEAEPTEVASRETMKSSAVGSQATLDDSDSNRGEESLTKQPLSEDEVKEAAQSSDPIESIALKVAKKETPINAGGDAAKDFKSWLSNHSQDSYSLQLFSHSDLKAAKRFQESLDLADSYVYPADIEGKKRYRVLWGAFKTRAEAKQAIESLPPEILAQKPWIRQFSAISKEVSD